jgi:hypothetical protein
MTHTIRFGTLGAAASILILAIGTAQRAYSAENIEVRTVSSRPDVVSGGTVLVEVHAPADSGWHANLDGRDVTQSFRSAASPARRLALLSGLRLGKNVLTIRANGRTASKLEILNHPLAGPVFSGPHQKPFLCQTDANGLGPAQDTDCFAKTIVQYYYKSTQPPDASAAAAEAAPGKPTAGFKTYDPNAPRPADVAQTVTSDGRTVDYIVRRELGVINRGVYDIQFLHRPGEPLPSPWTGPHVGWNGRLVYEFYVGCGPGYRQGTLPDPIGAVQEPLLSKGYALATSTLNSFGNDCNDRISAETASMVKEHFIESYGEPAHTIGWGGSGGGMQVQMIAQNYPGLLDGIIPMASFPDVATGFMPLTSDCLLLGRAFDSSELQWTQAQKTAVSGYSTWNMCGLIVQYKLHTLDPRNCDAAIPKEMIYDRNTNPQGARCDLYANEVNVYGRDPRTGFARRPLDNVGVQYGLVAFNSGKIDAEQFVELNERMGGYDEDGNFVTARIEADPQAVRLAYERGLVLTGGGGLGEVPIIDWRPYTDDLGGADGHIRFLSFVTRARLVAANGNADNQVILVDSRGAWFDWKKHFWFPIGDLVPQMDRWLDNIAADRAAGTPAEKVVRARPKDIEDSCTTIGGEKIVERATYDGPGRCNQLYPSYGDPRVAAGSPVAIDILKCALKPIRLADYSQPLSEAQLKRLRTVFQAGVCDYSRPGMGQEVTRTTWQRF